jgi:flagellar hook-associated protein 1 FlgK
MQPLSDLGYGVPAGTDERLVINVADDATGEVTQYELSLDTTLSADAFLISLRDSINANVNHVTASIDEGKLRLQADSGYAFDFALPYDPNPARPGDITAANPTSPSILDAYSGDRNLEYDVTFLNAGQIGTDPITIQIQAREPGGPVLRTLTRQIDATYAPGGAIELENGLKLTLTAGNVAAGDSFSFVAHASMDTAGVLDALGLNTLFNGLGAGLIEVADRVYQDPANLAGALRPVPGDNHRLLDMSALRSAKSVASGSATLHEYYRSMVSDVATTRSTRTVAQQNEDQLVKDLQNRRDSVSGVSVDEEMTRIMQSRTLYQGALKYISTINQLMNDLFDLV